MTQDLIEGFLDFKKRSYDTAGGVMRNLVKEGQSPEYFIISCIDSRGNPGTIFSPAPGTFFAHKAMGAIVRPYKKGTALSAALQFALEYNKVKEIIILGHTGCGAVKALVEGLPDEEISSFVEVARSGLEKAKACTHAAHLHDDIYRHTEEQIILESAENLRTYPCVKKALDENRIVIKAWLFDMHAGDLLAYDIQKNEFVSLITTDLKKKHHAKTY